VSAGHLAENVMHFARVLRAAGIPAGTDKVLDALRALTHAGIERREDWYTTLACIFLSRREQKPLFDQAFAIFWRDPALLEKMMGLLLPVTYARGGQKDAGAVSRRVAEALLPEARREAPGTQQPEQVEVMAEWSFSASERLQHMDFEDMSRQEWDEAKRVVSALRLPLPTVPTRRFDRASCGSRIDLPATLRALVRSGGDWAHIERRRRRYREPPLVVLADVSGSMHRYSRMFLYFIHALARRRDVVHALTFGTRLTSISRALRHRDVDLAVQEIAAKVTDWAGGTRIYSSIREFNRRWSRRLLGQNAVVLLITDGLDREAEDGLGDEMALLHRSCRRLIWLNPLLRYDGFQAKPAGIRAMLPHVDDFLPVHNIESLTQLAQQLGAAR
jgi:hypothetical protein